MRYKRSDPNLRDSDREAGRFAYRGYSVNRRLRGDWYDISKDGVHIGGAETALGARVEIDNLIDDPRDIARPYGGNPDITSGRPGFYAVHEDNKKSSGPFRLVSQAGYKAQELSDRYHDTWYVVHRSEDGDVTVLAAYRDGQRTFLAPAVRDTREISRPYGNPRRRRKRIAWHG